jgi:hypothetical protein
LAIRREDSHDDWQSTLAFFKQNPAALLDAIPTPRNDEHAIQEFEKCLTPKKGPDF